MKQIQPTTRARLPRFARALTAGFLLGAVTLGAGSTASAADPTLALRSVDTREFPQVSLTALLPSSGDLSTVKVTENGKAVDASVKSFADTATPTGLAVLIDSSADSVVADTLSKEKAAASALVNNLAPGQKMAVIAYNTGARPVVNFTTDKGQLLAGIDNLSASGDAALWDGLRLASALLKDQPDLQPNVVVMNASRDAISNATADAAGQGLLDANAALFATTVSTAKVTEKDALTSMANQTRGRFVETSDPSAFLQVLSGVQNSLKNQALIEYSSATKPGALDVAVTGGGASAVAHTSANTYVVGNATTAEAIQAKNLGIFAGPLGLFLLGLFALAGVGLFVYVVSDVATGDRHQLSRALRPYNTDDEGSESDLSKLADSQFVKKAVAKTASMADNRGLLDIVAKRLEQAELPLKPAEAIFFTVVTAAVAMVIGLIVGDLVGLFGAGLLFAFLPVFLLDFKAKARRRKFTKQLPDTLQLLAGSLRAGYSLVQGIDAVAKQVDAPMGTELTRALSEARLGRPVEDALQEVSDRMQSDDFEWAVMAIKIQREVGGNLAELLNTVADTMIERERLRREVKALTAEGRISAIILVGLPPVIGGLISIMNPVYMQPMFHSLIGQIALVVAVMMMGVGYFLMNKMIKIEV